MRDVLMRAEQGVLGSLLADVDQPQLFGRLYTEDFSHPVHQDIYQTLSDLYAAGGNSDSQRLAHTVAEAVGRPEVNTEWLQALATSAPGPDITASYARIIQQSAFDRDSAEFGTAYQAAARLSTESSTQERLTRVQQALNAQAAIFTPASTIDPDQGIRMTLVDVAQTGATTQREDLIIADLIQHPEHVQHVADWLDTDLFTSEQRRLSFEIVTAAAIEGEPVDAVIIAWRVQRARDVAALHGREVPLSNVAQEPDYTYLNRVQHTAVKAGTAVILGRELLTEHVQATLALSATAAAERAISTGKTIQVGPLQVGGLEAPLSVAPVVESRRIEL